MDVMIKKGGKTYQRTKQPIFACFNKDCKRKWHSGGQDWETSVSAFWSHLEQSSKTEEQEAKDGGDRTVMVHSIKEMLAQYTTFSQ